MNDISKYFCRNLNNKNLMGLFEEDKFYLENHLIFEEVINTFLSNNDEAFIENKHFSKNINENDLLLICYEFFKYFDKNYFENIIKIFKNKDHIISFCKNYSSKYFCALTYKYYNQIKIDMKITYTINDIYTLVHELGHAINFLNNDFKNFEIRRPFSEIESIFLELILTEFLIKFFDKKNLEYFDRKNYVNLFYDATLLKLKYEINDIALKNDDFINVIKSNFNLSKKSIKNIYNTNAKIIMPYVISKLYAYEIYDIYQTDKEKAINIYKDIIKFDSPSLYSYISLFENHYLYPNETDTFIRKALKK